LDRERIPKLQSLEARGRSRDDALRDIASFFGKLHPKANFEEEKDESQSNQPCGNKYQRRPAGTQVAKQLTDCAHDEFAVWQYSVNSMAHPRGSNRQCCSAGDCGSKQPENCSRTPNRVCRGPSPTVPGTQPLPLLCSWVAARREAVHRFSYRR